MNPLLVDLPPHITNAIETYIPTYEGWLDVNRGCEMAMLIIETKPDVVVEIGVFGGRSLISQGFALRENHRGKIYGIDPWAVEIATEGNEDPENIKWWSSNIDIDKIHQDCMKAIWDHRLQEFVVVIRAASQHAYQLFPNNIDILYIDGNHSELSSCRDVELFVPRVKPGGWVWFDDCDWPTTQKALSMMDWICDLPRNNGNYRLYRKR